VLDDHCDNTHSVNPLRAVVVGAGYMGSLHAAKLASIPGVVVTAVADIDSGRAHALAQRVGCTAHPDWQSLVEKADLAVVAVPTALHAEIAATLLSAGVHVLVEKPFTRSLDEAAHLAAVASTSGRVLQVAHVERFNAAFRAIAARLDRPLFIDCERLSAFKERGANVDVVLDLMIHDLDLMLALAQSDVASVTACGFGVITRGIDIANAYIEFANGCVANLSASRVSQSPVRKLRVFQPDLYVSADLQAGALRYVRQDAGAICEQSESHERGDALQAQAEAFVAAVRGEARVAVTADDGRRALELALCVGRLVHERLARFNGASA
jgi:predicted dehydrogenase